MLARQTGLEFVDVFFLSLRLSSFSLSLSFSLTHSRYPSLRYFSSSPPSRLYCDTRNGMIIHLPLHLTSIGGNKLR